MYEIPNFIFSFHPDLEKNCLSHNEKTGENLTKNDFLPTRGKDQDVGYDVRCAVPAGVVFKPFDYNLVNLGIRMFAPQNWWLFLPPRSGTFVKKKVHALYGVIDPNYENYLGFACQYVPEAFLGKKEDEENELSIKPVPNLDPLEFKFGDRIAQVIPMPRYDMITSVKGEKEFEQICKERGWSRGTTGINGSGDR